MEIPQRKTRRNVKKGLKIVYEENFVGK